MRLFFAAEFAPPLRQAVSEAITRARIPNPPWRWVAGENIHVTLKFLGETPEEIIPELVEVVGGACAGMAPFDILLGGLGGFPNLQRPRVLFYEVTTGARELVALAGAIDTGLSDGLGIPREDRPFKAHATVARVKSAIAPDLAARLAKAPPVERGFQKIEKVTLMESQLRPQGALYCPVKSIALTGVK
jgi:RNA 2',3'-cyclic 3'-phosphodiesterase